MASPTRGLRPLDPRRRAAAVVRAARRAPSVRSGETSDLAARSQLMPGSEQTKMGSGAYWPQRVQGSAWPFSKPSQRLPPPSRKREPQQQRQRRPRRQQRHGPPHLSPDAHPRRRSPIQPGPAAVSRIPTRTRRGGPFAASQVTQPPLWRTSLPIRSAVARRSANSSGLSWPARGESEMRSVLHAPNAGRRGGQRGGPPRLAPSPSAPAPALGHRGA